MNDDFKLKLCDRSARVAAIACMLPAMAYAQTYPSRPITVIVPFPAGGPSDVVARIVPEAMSDARSDDGDRECRRRRRHARQRPRRDRGDPDGYTLLAGSMGSHVAAPVLTPNVRYDSERDFIPVGITARCAGRDRRAQGFPGERP